MCLCAALLHGCNLPPKPGLADVPPLPRSEPGVYTDINPRWSHDGKRIAFLRATPDRRLQLFLTDGDLDRATALLEPELVSPDRPYDPRLSRYASPDTLAWSHNDRRIAFARVEWFQFEDGQRLPGTGIWSIDLHSGLVSAIALHPKRYNNLYYYYHTPVWSPDGSYVAFIAEGINGQRALALRCVGAEMPKEVAPRFDNYASSDWPAWRPQAPAKSVKRGTPPSPGVDIGPIGRISPISPIAGQTANANPARPVLAYTQQIYRTPAVRATATLRAMQPGASEPGECRELWRIGPAAYADTEAVRRRANHGDVIEPRAGQPVWSPNGRRIAYTLTPDPLDFSRYEVWVLDANTGAAKRASPADSHGYFAPVWIDNDRLGALSPIADRFEALTVDIGRGTTHRIGTIDTADCDWSPDRSRIVYAAPPSGRANSPDDPTTLRTLDTHLRPLENSAGN